MAGWSSRSTEATPSACARRTSLAALNMTEDTKQFSLSAGIASFKIRRLDDYEVFEVDTPNAAVTFETPGDYRIDVRTDGSTRIQVRRGQATVASGGGQVPLGSGDAIYLEGYDSPRYDFVSLGSDGWDGWVAGRDAQYSRIRSYEYVSPSIAGVEDLDGYGQWQQVPYYGWCWTPATVAAGWAPYRAGRWMWQDPWGWTWVSTERWGWAPYHYGRWVSHQVALVLGARSRVRHRCPTARRSSRSSAAARASRSPSASDPTTSAGSRWLPASRSSPGGGGRGQREHQRHQHHVRQPHLRHRGRPADVRQRARSVATNYVRDRAIITASKGSGRLAARFPCTRRASRSGSRREAAPAPRPPADGRLAGRRRAAGASPGPAAVRRESRP